MAELIQQSLRKERVTQLTLQGMKQKEIVEAIGIKKSTVHKYQKELRPLLERSAEKIEDFVIKQKLKLMKKRFEVFDKVLSAEICDENFYRQLKAAAQSVKDENETLLMMERIKGKRIEEVREDVWTTVLKHIEEQERTIGAGKVEGAGIEGDGSQKDEQ